MNARCGPIACLEPSLEPLINSASITGVDVRLALAACLP